jgi:peptide deformylase
MIGSDREDLVAEPLKIIFWPDPRLKRLSQPVKIFDEKLRELAAAMLELMRAEKGVGLAAPQVGRNFRLFVMNATGEPGDDRIYVNPELFDADGEETGEEGCLSLPEIRIDVVRSKTLRIAAYGLDGKPFEQTATGFPARVWQHEFDHLNGTLLVDRMGPVARMANRWLLKNLEERYEKEHPTPPPPPPPTAPKRRTASRKSRK